MTERDIQKIIRQDSEQKKDSLAVIPNLYLNDQWEADLIKIKRNGEVEEYEIKTSSQDFKNDFKNKTEKHNAFKTLFNLYDLPNQFYFICPEGIIEPEQIPEYAGLKVIRKRGLQKQLKTVKLAPTLHNERLDANRWRSIAIKIANRYL